MPTRAEKPKWIIHPNEFSIITEEQQQPSETVLTESRTNYVLVNSSFFLRCGVQAAYGVDVTYVWSIWNQDIPFDRISKDMRRIFPTQFEQVSLTPCSFLQLLADSFSFFHLLGSFWKLSFLNHCKIFNIFAQVSKSLQKFLNHCTIFNIFSKFSKWLQNFPSLQSINITAKFLNQCKVF